MLKGAKKEAKNDATEQERDDSKHPVEATAGSTAGREIEMGREVGHECVLKVDLSGAAAAAWAWYFISHASAPARC